MTKMTVGMSSFTVPEPDVEATPVDVEFFALPSSCSSIGREFGVTRMPLRKFNRDWM